MNHSLEKILRNFPAECDATGTFVMRYLTISVKHHRLDPKFAWKPPKAHASLEML